MKNICFFNTVRFWGGGEKFYFEYATRLRDRGYNVFIVCGKDSVLAEKARKEKIPYYEIEINMGSFLNPVKRNKVKHYFQENKIDTVIMSTSQDVKIGGIMAKKAGVDRIVFRRGLAAPIANRPLNRYVFGKVVTHIFANSEETKKTIRQHLGEVIPEAKIEVIYNGIDLSTIDFSPKKLEVIEKRGKGVVLGSAGRLTDQKKQTHLIKVAKKLKEDGINFTLFIAGKGELQEKLQEEINQLDLQDNIYLIDFVEDINRFMGSIDIFLLSSEWEGFGYVLVEAMVQQVPVVAYNITSNPEIVANNQTAFLAEYANLDEFSEHAKRLIEDAELRTEMGKKGLERVKKHFTIEKSVDALEKFLLKA